ncbi:Sugar efflux transporter for intercellular exchange [Phytophthora infestans]|uniref:Sugar transporter SWEET1 n=1 Tax=Phytophthora infestans TaxID=4787 RepID=A0A833S2X3_PHYIN|nr:Sugar efflux transporter for intercellular exchange [Phytophthora infestans]
MAGVPPHPAPALAWKRVAAACGHALCNAFMWCVYGCVADSIFPLVVVNAFGVCTSLIFSAIYVRWGSTEQQIYARRLWVGAGTAMLLVTSYAVLGVCGAIYQHPDEVVATLGSVCVICNIFLFASPLETLGKVIRTKSAASLPIELCVANLVAGALWSALAIGQNDMFVLTPNALGTMLGALQVALYLVYPPRFQAVLRPERSRPLPIITSTSKPDELSIKVAVQGPVFLPEPSSLTSLVAPSHRGVVISLLPGSYGSQSVEVAAGPTNSKPFPPSRIRIIHSKEAQPEGCRVIFTSRTCACTSFALSRLNFKRYAVYYKGTATVLICLENVPEANVTHAPKFADSSSKPNIPKPLEMRGSRQTSARATVLLISSLQPGRPGSSNAERDILLALR